MVSINELRVQELEPKPLSAAFMFPGQGLPSKNLCFNYQHLKEIDEKLVLERIKFAQQIFNEINGTTGIDIAASLKDENSSNFTLTSFVQPVVYTLSMLNYEFLKEKIESKIKPEFFLGHSLGEYSALTAAGVIKLPNGQKLVTYRGKFMQEACKRIATGHISIIGLTEDEVKTICENIGAEIALVNAPNLIVVGARRCDQFEKIKAAARRTKELSTAGAFHTSYMLDAALELAKNIQEEKIEFSKPSSPIITNFSAQPVNDPQTLREHLIQSMINPVKWSKSLEFLKNAGIEAFLEIGPGNSLSALNEYNGIPKSQIKNSNNIFGI